MITELLRLRIVAEHDVFAGRQLARDAAAALGLEHQDQIRIATALSEVGRQLLTYAGGLTVTFGVDEIDLWLRVDLVASNALETLPAEVTESLGAAEDRKSVV